MTPALRIIGVPFDDKYCFDQQTSGVLDRAKLRHGIVARLARSTWGLEISLLPTSHAALLRSLVRSALVTTGSGSYPRCLRKLEPQHANILASRVVAISRSATLLALHVCADVRLVRNLFIRHCALMSDRAPQASEGSLQTRLQGEMRRSFQVPPEFTGARGIWEQGIKEAWITNLLSSRPVTAVAQVAGSTFHLTADLFMEGGNLRFEAWAFPGTEDWRQVGLLVCVYIDARDVPRAAPPCLHIRKLLLRARLMP